MESKELLQKFISIPSVSGDEARIQAFLAKTIKEIGYRPVQVGDNLLFYIPGKNSRKALIFNAHVDTVPAGDIKLWRHSPYSGKKVGKKVYGLGASDEKSGVALLVLLAKEFFQQ